MSNEFVLKFPAEYSYSIFGGFFSGYEVRCNTPTGGYEWLGHHKNEYAMQTATFPGDFMPYNFFLFKSAVRAAQKHFDYIEKHVIEKQE